MCINQIQRRAHAVSVKAKRSGGRKSRQHGSELSSASFPKSQLNLMPASCAGRTPLAGSGARSKERPKRTPIAQGKYMPRTKNGHPLVGCASSVQLLCAIVVRKFSPAGLSEILQKVCVQSFLRMYKSRQGCPAELLCV